MTSRQVEAAVSATGGSILLISWMSLGQRRGSGPGPAPVTLGLPEATSEPSNSGHAARKRKQLKSKLAAADSAKPGVRVVRCLDDDDEEDEC